MDEACWIHDLMFCIFMGLFPLQLTNQMSKLKQSEQRDAQLTSELAQKVSEGETESSPDQLLQVIRYVFPHAIAWSGDVLHN